MKRRKYADIVTTAIGVLLIAVLIQALGLLRQDRLVFPDITEIMRAFVRLLGEVSTYRMLLTTFTHLLTALIISAAAGVSIGFLEGLHHRVDRLLRPLMTFLRSVPMIVLIIITMVVSDYSHVPVIAASLILVPLISEATKEGCRSIPPELIDVYRMNSDLNLPVLTRVYLPLMAGYLRQAFAEAAGMGAKLVITGEYMVQTRDSLGKAIYSSAYFNEYQDIYALALIMVLMVLLLGVLPLRLLRSAE